MTVEQQVRTPMSRPRPGAAVGTARLATPPRQSGPDDSPLCLVIPEIADGEGTALVRSLRRRESTRAVLLTRKAGRREFVVLLGGGVPHLREDEPGVALRYPAVIVAATALVALVRFKSQPAFVILAAAVFIVIVKAVGLLMRQAEKPKVTAPPALTKDQELLVEIRDLLRSQRSQG